MTIPWSPVVSADMVGPVLALGIAVCCAVSAGQWARRRPNDIFRHYIVLLSIAIVLFAGSRSCGHLLQQLLLLQGAEEIWRHLAPYCGAVTTVTFVIIFAFSISFHRFQKAHCEVEQYRNNLEELVYLRTRELQQANRTLENVLNTSIPICITGLDYQIVLANDSYKRTFEENGHGEKGGQKCYESRPGPTCETDSCPIKKIQAGATEVMCEPVKTHADGSKQHFIVTARPFRNQEGQLEGIVECFQDITRRKNAELERDYLIEKLQKALSEIKTLQGILPICSFCKNIRNDEGYYEQIEAYIHKHSGADFSHTVCPGCLKEHYPEVYASLLAEGQDKP